MSELSSRSRIAALDGWRGIAIALVLFSHVQVSLFHHYWWRWSATGSRGVSLFFVLSGFLITSTLIESPDLKKFYVRRCFRLMPAAWTYLATLLIASQVLHNPLTTPREVFACVFFFRNFLGPIGSAGHFWSLSIEEQFYLFWPCALFVVGPRRGIWLAGIAAACSAVSRAIFWTNPGTVAPTWFNVDGLLVGCMFALLVGDPRANGAIAKLARFAPFAVLIYLSCLVISPEGHARFIENICMGLLISATAIRSDSRMSRALSFGPLTWLGRVSYSVYLWQGVFMGFGNALMLCTFLPAFALGSYYLIEKPLTAFGRRLAGRSVHIATEPLNATVIP